ncbi:MAG TPA: hypothetical protein VE777_08075 [Gaiellales bacterium]|jgi:hypothetical protein|nr:hypothetical protein [Gaiellales bacterium]
MRPTLAKIAAHNLDAAVAIAALPVFALAGWPLEGWFWATALWAANRYLQVVTERRAARMGALTGVGVLGASMLLRPWIGMLALFLITRHDSALAISSVLLFLLLLTIDIGTRIVTHRNIGRGVGGTA